MIYRKWLSKDIDKSDVENLKNDLQINTLLAKILASKGIKTKDEANKRFFHNQELSDPFLIKDMDKAVFRIHKAIEEDEKIVVYGDYDVDGVCATAVLFSYLESQGANVFYKIPNREKEGYGMNKAVLKALKDKGVSLVVTVDNGISAISEVEYANEIGLDIIITDHHLPKETLPNAYAIVDPLRKDDESPAKTLAGVGVAFKLVCALEYAQPEDMLEFFADLVCVGTVADLMKLEGENRVIVKEGLKILNQNPRQGFLSLLKSYGYNINQITSETIAFTIAPRINASGRMSDATLALELLLEDDEDAADEIAKEIESENLKRQETQNKIAEQIINEISLDKSLIDERVLVVYNESYHPGVIGIVASKLVEKYGKPAIVLAKNENEYKGSGRSISSFSLHGALLACSEYLLSFGGHELAAGVSVLEENLEVFKKAINEYANNNQELAKTQPLKIDCILELDEINVNSVAEMDYLAPFGAGNETPVFSIQNVGITSVSPIKDGKHTMVRLKKDNLTLQGIFFNKALADFPYNNGDLVDVSFMLSIYQGANGDMVSTKIKDIQPSKMPNEIVDSFDLYKVFKNKIYLNKEQKDKLMPTREEVVKIYRYIQTNKVKNDDLRPLFVKFLDIDSAKIQIILDVLLDFKLIEVSLNMSENYYKIVPTQNKVDLMESHILKSLN